MSNTFKEVKKEEPSVDFLKIERSLLSQAYFQLKEVLKKTEESEKRYRLFFDGLTDSVFVHGITDEGLPDKFIEVNDVMCKMMGYSKEELLNMTVLQLNVQGAVPIPSNIAERLIKGEHLIFEQTFAAKDGHHFFAEANTQSFIFEGRPVILTILRDITERKKNEEMIVRTNRLLRMLSSTNQALIHIDEEKTLLDKICSIITEIGVYHFLWIGFAEQDEIKTMHPVAEAGFGIEYLTKTHIAWSDTGTHSDCPIAVAIRTGKTQIVNDVFTEQKMVSIKKEASVFGYKSFVSLPLKNNGQIIGVLSIYSDELNAFYDKEIEMLEELAGDLSFGIATIRLRKKVSEKMKEIDVLKNKFIQIVSHQLRTPLGVIRWNLEAILARERGEVSPAQMETLRGAYAADIEVISRIDDLIIAIDIEEGRMILMAETVNLSELFLSVSEESLQLCQLKNITYEISEPKQSIPFIQVDAEKIKEVVERLLDNAITYTHDNGHIIVRFFTKDQSVRFEVSDTGIGIPASERPRIFERFHRGWNAAQMKPDASGLSLFIAKHYISGHHGTIGFTSEEKKGSTFWFELPLV